MDFGDKVPAAEGLRYVAGALDMPSTRRNSFPSPPHKHGMFGSTVMFLDTGEGDNFDLDSECAFLWTPLA